MASLTLAEDGSTDPAMSMAHPKNQVKFHEIIIHPDVDATKDFTDLANPQQFCKLLNKTMKLGQHFKIPDVSEEAIAKDPRIQARFMNTTRNGFVSALAMSYNYHLPLILSPNDIWLVVLQGLRLHMGKTGDKAFMQNVFKDLDKVPKTAKKYFKLKDAKNDAWHPDITKIKEDKFEQALFGAIEHSMNKVWNEKHVGVEFSPSDDMGEKLVPVEKLTDVFTYTMTSDLDIALALEKNKLAAHEKAKDDAFEVGQQEPDAPELLSEEAKQKLQAQHQRTNQFYNCIFAMTTINSSHMVLHDQKTEENCGVPKVKFLGTLRDWKILKKKITYLDRFGCHKWLDVLLPVINKFIAAIAEGEVDKDFWKGMYGVVPRTNQTSANKVNGWICNFFPYSAQECKPNFESQARMKQMFREREEKVVTHMMDEDEFYRGVSASTLAINKKEYAYVCGFLGVEFETVVPDANYPDEVLQAVKPAVGWTVYEEDASLKGTSRVFLAAETSGSLF